MGDSGRIAEVFAEINGTKMELYYSIESICFAFSERIYKFVSGNYSLLSEKELRQAIKDSIINPNMSRADLEAWTAEQRGGSKEEEDVKDRVIATLLVPSDFERDTELQQAIDKLKIEFGLVVERPRDIGLEAESRMYRKITEYIQKGARKYIREMKATRLRGKHHLTPTMRKRLWSYSDDEVEIRPDATWEDVERILDYVGSADQFERLRDEALRLHGVSEKLVKKHVASNQTLTPEEVTEMLALQETIRGKHQELKFH